MPDESVNRSFYEIWELLGELVEDAWLRRGENTVYGITGVPAPTLNGVWSGSDRLDPAEAAAGLDEVAGTGLPHCLQFSASAPASGGADGRRPRTAPGGRHPPHAPGRRAAGAATGRPARG